MSSELKNRSNITKMTSKERRFPTLTKRKGSVPTLISKSSIGGVSLERSLSKSSTHLQNNRFEPTLLSPDMKYGRRELSYFSVATGSSQGSSDRAGRRTGRAKIPVTSSSTSRFFINHESETIENSDVFANEDFEYIIQAERSQESYISDMKESSAVHLMDMDPSLNSDETDFILPPPALHERKSSFSSSIGSRDSFGRIKNRATIVLNSKFSSKLYLQTENSGVEIRPEDQIKSPIDGEVELEPFDIFKSDIIVVDESKLKDRKVTTEGNKTKDQKIPKEKLEGNFFSRAVKRAQSFGKNKNIKTEDKNNHHYFTIRGRKRKEIKEEAVKRAL